MSIAAAMPPLLLLLLGLVVAAAIPNPDPALIHPSLLFPSASVPPSTIPAFPEQSDAAASTTTTCPLDLSPSLLHAVSHSCSSSSSSSSLPSRSRCCPTLAAWLLSAYASTALRAPPPQPLSDLPVLPDDSESCADGAEAAIRSRGISLPRVNGTCGIAYCYCGVRLRRLSCPSAFSASGDQSRWSPNPAIKKKLQNDCKRPGIAGCSRCLSTLNQLRTMAGNGGNATKSGKKPASHEAKPDDGECQMMGLTWLLSRNRTLYLPTATAVLRSFLATAAGTGAPTSCSLPHDDMPLAVDSSQLDGRSSSAPLLPLSHHSPLLSLLINFVLVLFGVFLFA